MVEIRYVEQGRRILGLFHDGEAYPHTFIADVARTCYRSTGIGDGADRRLVASLVENGHTAMVEHSFLSVEFVTDRAVANEIVRHRHFSFAQESTRYVNYGRRGFEFVMPDLITPVHRKLVEGTCEYAAEAYDSLVSSGAPAEIARSVLPLCTATRIVVSGNFTEWRHFFKLRCDRRAHPMMRSRRPCWSSCAASCRSCSTTSRPHERHRLQGHLRPRALRGAWRGVHAARHRHDLRGRA